MTRPKGFDYPRVKIPSDGDAKLMLQAEADYYGKTLGELISDIAMAWTKMKRGEWNQYWPLQAPQTIVPGGVPVVQKNTEAEEEQKRKEEDKRRRAEALKAAARAELLDDL